MLHPQEFSHLTRGRILKKVEVQGGQHHMQRVTHSFEINLASNVGRGRFFNVEGFGHAERMVAAFVTTTKV